MTENLKTLKDKIKRLDNVYGKGFFNESVETQKKEARRRLKKMNKENCENLKNV